jgi:2-polyprenyl-6-methoxyphenol hydroxylase-like FAD-dependent oxidoreductase
LERVEESDDEVVARFADGTRAEADLIVGADGLFSTLRQQFLPEVRPRYAGYVAWRGIVDEVEVSAETRRVLRLVRLRPAAG